MSNPKHTLLWMSIYLFIVGIVCALIYAPLHSAFQANWVFNTLILSVLIIGIVISYRQVVILIPELEWIASFRTGDSSLSVKQEPRLLKPLTRQLGTDLKKDRFRMSAMSLRTVLDGIRARLDESREISRYMISLLIFLGLLGTFWGLLGTITSVGNVIINLSVDGGDFKRLVLHYLAWVARLFWVFWTFRPVTHKTAFTMDWKSGWQVLPNWLIVKIYWMESDQC